MKRFLFTISLLSSTAFGNDLPPVKIAVLDTGYDVSDHWDEKALKAANVKAAKICNDQAFGVLKKPDNAVKPAIPMVETTDLAGHGTHIVGTIASNWGDANACIIPIKSMEPNPNILLAVSFITDGVKKAIELNVDFINISAGGTNENKEECLAIKEALDKGIIVVAAAGNERSNINTSKYWPAMCDDRIIAVMNVSKSGKTSELSNYTDNKPGSRVLESEMGENVMSTLPHGAIGAMTGTSMSAAIMTGRLVMRYDLLRRDKYFKILKAHGK